MKSVKDLSSVILAEAEDGTETLVNNCEVVSKPLWVWKGNTKTINSTK